MSIIQRTLGLNQSKLKASTVFAKDDSSLLQKSIQTEEDLMTTATDYFSHYGSKSKQSNSASFTHNAIKSNTLSSIGNCNKTDSAIKEPTSLEALITTMKESVSIKMKEDLANQRNLFKNRSKTVSKAETSLNNSKNGLDESIHSVYSLFQENTKLFYQKTRFEKENRHNARESALLKKQKEKMEKDIADLDKGTRMKTIDLICAKKELQIASKGCKDMAVSISNQIEDNKSLRTALLLTQLKVEKMKEVLFRYRAKENNVAEQIKDIISQYSR